MSRTSFGLICFRAPHWRR